ncbi:uncharacterized protein ASCRUDRAFT_51905 [Ascoidea rubescens DSM 1968]|uniref:WD40 repeat-like protein n=1 Tax=Ascoidea rubescens DSM 1968 TaxID=1344418 RepID=A0A1D2V8R5_9ASCO|nr:WD40 repeat-like protein [Ascoidea rubescens DSM 1968]ODV57833.1 WD40 repeat-like protein [Ascoidea rubescens DSM 1968]
MVLHGFPTEKPLSSSSGSSSGNLSINLSFNEIQRKSSRESDDDEDAKHWGYEFFEIAEIKVNYPCTKIQWDPIIKAGGNLGSGSPTGASCERFASCGNSLKIWEVHMNSNDPNVICEKLSLPRSSKPNVDIDVHSLAPLTSLDWNKIDTNMIITSSIDTTCTVWDLNQGVAKTQLIAHDSEVFDVQFVAGSKDIFTSVGNDGSMRIFDLRSLKHSTIIYEPLPSAPNASMTSSQSQLNYPLLRVATSNIDEDIIAAIAANSSSIIIVDRRYPGLPLLTLEGHDRPVNSIKWHPTKQVLLSGSDDCQAFIWDLSSGEKSLIRSQHFQQYCENKWINGTNSTIKNNVIICPSAAHGENYEINNVSWNVTGDWFGLVCGKEFQGVKIKL